VAPLLTAALIVRDEAAVLEDCLESIADVADEIVIVDTGSTDGTIDIARRRGAVVIEHPWADDFAEARNVGLERATGDWVLYIDADERLVEPDRHRMQALLRGSDAAALRVLFHPQLDASAYLEFRIWRNHPSIRFEGIIHETVVPAIVQLAEREGRPIDIADLVLRHLGYEGDQRKKHFRNLPLLRRELDRNPSNLFVRHHLFRVLSGLGEDEEAASVLADALLQVDALEAAGKLDELGALILYEVIRGQPASGPRRDLLARALGLYPDNCAFLIVEARQLVDDGAFEAAIERVDRVFQLAGSTPSRVAYNTRLLREAPHEIKALCLFRLARFEEAAAEYAHAAELVPSEMSYRVKRDLAAALAREPREADC
jgi:tetratricopeptide (TPR) repeat protein